MAVVKRTKSDNASALRWQGHPLLTLRRGQQIRLAVVKHKLLTQAPSLHLRDAPCESAKVEESFELARLWAQATCSSQSALTARKAVGQHERGR